MQNATEHPANTFGGQGTPACLRVIEIMGIQQARQWGVCTMNEFRKYLGLKRMSWLFVRYLFYILTIYFAEFKTFEEWNPDPEIAVSDCQNVYYFVLEWLLGCCTATLYPYRQP